MFQIGYIKIEKALLLAPMEDVTDMSFRLVCKNFGADIVYTEFVNSEGLTRDNVRTFKKMQISDKERPICIQIYGEKIESMTIAAKKAEEQNPDFIDINAGCWVKKIASRGAGAGLLRDLSYFEKMVKSVVSNVKKPITVKTRIGWDSENINILETARMLEANGISALTIHCRTKTQGHSGEPDWSWIEKVKNVVKIPIALNGGVFQPEDVKKAFDKTGADAVMIARGAIGQPWIFVQAKELIKYGKILTTADANLRISTALKHLKDSIPIKGETRAVLEFRKFYSGYLKGLFNASKIRNELMKIPDYAGVEKILLDYLEFLKNENVDKVLLEN